MALVQALCHQQIQIQVHLKEQHLINNSLTISGGAGPRPLNPVPQAPSHLGE